MSKKDEKKTEIIPVIYHCEEHGHSLAGFAEVEVLFQDDCVASSVGYSPKYTNNWDKVFGDKTKQVEELN